MYWILGVALWIIVVVGGGAALAAHDLSVHWLPEFRFAGVDVLYAMRRVAGEAGLAIAVDEVKPRGAYGDLGWRRVDLDVRSGPVREVARQIQREVGAFDFEISPGVLFVRANLPTQARTDLDVPRFPAGTFEGNFRDLVRTVMTQESDLLLRPIPHPGPAARDRVQFDIAEGASVMEVMLQWAEESGNGWFLSRSGYEVDRGETKVAIEPSMTRLWHALPEAVIGCRYCRREARRHLMRSWPLAADRSGSSSTRHESWRLQSCN